MKRQLPALRTTFHQAFERASRVAKEAELPW